MPDHTLNLTNAAAVLLGQTVTIGGQEWPVALAFAIINAVYIKMATPLPTDPTL